MMNFTFAEEKIRARIDALAELRYKNRISLNDWFVKEDTSKAEKYPPADFEDWQTFTLGERWSGRDYYLWIQRQIEIPDKRNLVLLFDFGKTGGGYNSGFESLFFVDGEPYQGVDSNHQEVFVGAELLGKTITVSLRLWSGLEGGGPEQIQSHQFLRGELVELEPICDEFYYLSDMVLKTIQELDENDPLKYQLLDVLNRGYLLIDWSEPASDNFYQTIAEAHEYLNEAIHELDQEKNIKITALGHTHIDVAWLWRLKHTQEKAARSFSTVLKLMERYPEYIFLQTQPQLYKYIKKDYPEIYQKIKERVKEGRWEVDGAMWLEADCNIPSGESLTRQILHGSKFIKEEFNQDMNYLWLPDVFGYSWALPQILKKSGINTFMTTKISWNQFNRMPHDTFIWKGMDGSEILTHFVTTPEPKPLASWASEWFYTYNGQLEPETVLGAYRGYRDKDINNHLLISYGYGDGGGGVTRDMLEKRRQMDKIPGLPKVETGQAKAYFEELQQTFAETDHYVHEWDGELYLEYHRGTYTSQAFVKKMNRQIELMLRELEMLYTFAEMQEATYPKETLFDLWETLLRNQFHDIIPGSSIKEVYQDHKAEFAEVTATSEKLLAALNEKTEKLLVVNTASWQRGSLIKISVEGASLYQDEKSRQYPTIKVGDERILFVPEVAALSDLLLTPVQQEVAPVETATIAVVKENQLETDFYRLQWNQAGQLISLFDKENQREVLKGKGNVLQVFEDKPKDYDAWDIDIFYQEKMTEVPFEAVTVKENNPFFVELALTATIGNSKLAQNIKLYRHTRRIDFETAVDWQERQRLLKVAFDVDIRATAATYDIQYGNVKRPTHWNTSWDMAKFETVGHQWADLSENNYGVSLLNNCKYGYDIKGSVMRLSLLKGGIYPDPTADIGHHEFTYSLLPHTGDFIAGKTVMEAWEINAPLTVLQRQQKLMPAIKLATETPIALDALKKSEDGDGWIMRIHEFAGGRSNWQMTAPTVNAWQETNLMEVNQAEKQTGEIACQLEPYEVKTIRLH
ncbi:alpha-mannosidase [Enterococcus sp. PF1-24]|uniref:alpha-mannosidase n=1 Tax=unclassified Enterococcus TaxID=2608891 RepID=UPI002475E0DD|nr:MULTISPECIES: alpha-mannosidase [unclassified Enterococcus]MDH6364662.1 alpha-mannosidase [Enterococcus sp. PFB1-1]MDH6401763.1 alpha-mannosidase [Enterococcus sp. PF1-24]